MANEEVLDALVGAAPTLLAAYDLETWARTLCASYERNESDFSAFMEALKSSELDSYDVDAVEQVLREQGEMSAVENLCRDGADALQQEFAYAVERNAEQQAPDEGQPEAPQEPAPADYNRDEAFPWVAGWANTIIANWDGTEETWPAFRQQVMALVEQQSGGRADMLSATTDFFAEIDGAGGDRVATLQAYGVEFPEVEADQGEATAQEAEGEQTATVEDLPPAVATEVQQAADEIAELFNDEDMPDLGEFTEEELADILRDAIAQAG